MNIFGEYYCVVCEKYTDKRFVHTKSGKTCICKSCYENLKKTKDKTFQGGGDLDFVLAPYIYHGELSESIKRYKFSGQWGYAGVFGELMYNEVSDYNWLSNYDCTIPVPLHETRLRERGYNQAELLAEVIARKTKLPIYTDALFRIRETKRQSSLVGIDRVRNVEKAFCAAESVVSGKRIILIDDICTMGETAKACAEALKNAGAKEIIAFTLCKAMI